MRPKAESGDRQDFSRFPEDANRPAADPGRLILGPFAPLAPRFRRLSYISGDAPLKVAPVPHAREFAPKPNPRVGGISENFACLRFGPPDSGALVTLTHPVLFQLAVWFWLAEVSVIHV